MTQGHTHTHTRTHTHMYTHTHTHTHTHVPIGVEFVQRWRCITASVGVLDGLGPRRDGDGLLVLHHRTLKRFPHVDILQRHCKTRQQGQSGTLTTQPTWSKTMEMRKDCSGQFGSNESERLVCLSCAEKRAGSLACKKEDVRRKCVKMSAEFGSPARRDG